VQPIIDQLMQFGETRRGWLGVRIQNVDDAIAESLKLGSPRGALVAVVDDKGPGRPAGLKAGDVILKFDGKDVKESRDLPKLVASTPVGKEVQVIVMRDGKEVPLKVTLGRLEDGERQASVDRKTQTEPQPNRSAVQKALGMEFGSLDAETRKRFNIKDSVKGVFVTGVDAISTASEKRIVPGDTIVEINQEPVARPADIAARTKALKDQGRKSALFLVANAQGEVRFVALSLE
jgi:serine protease Do